MTEPKDRPGLDYRSAGVDIEAADAMIASISGVAKSTAVPGVLGGLGGFGALFALKDAVGEAGLKDPVLVSGTDGVGTKLKVAFATGRHDTIGIDLVAMCVNDILTVGAKPLFFLDYFGTGHLEPTVGAAVVTGIAEGCRRAKCALVGGETAELPGMYAKGEYDLAGFAVGVVDRSAIIDGSSARAGQAVVGVFSEGVHSNGLSLARKVLLEHAGLALDAPLEGSEGPSVGDALLTPTALYTEVVEALLATARPSAMAHITGGGIPGNLPRVLPEGLAAELDRASWPVPAVFRRIAELGPVAEAEMDKTFNMGLGLMAVVDDGPAAVQAIESTGARAAVVGRLIERGDGPGVVYR